MWLNKQIYACTKESYLYERIASLGWSCGFNTDKIEYVEHLTSPFDYLRPNLIIVDTSMPPPFLEKLFKHLAYEHCPYAILLIGSPYYLKQTPCGLQEVIESLHFMDCINAPLRIEDMMEQFDKIQNEPSYLNIDSIKQGLTNKEFELYYQPSVNLNTKQIQGAEALIRWHHPQLTIIGPDKFIPIAETNHNLITDLTLWTLEICFEQFSSWQAVNLSMELNINLSSKVLSSPSLIATFEKLLKKYNIPASKIGLEISEKTAKTQSFQQHNDIFRQLQSMGFHIIIDDFDLSYCNLNELFNLHVDGFKINRTHIVDLDKNKAAQKLVKCLIDVAHNLDLSICATGVETAKIWQILTDLGCDHVQGYYICKPVAVNEFNKWVKISSTATS